jgi:hypothetical protein
MGHEAPGMRGVYSHITPGMREDLVAGLQELWEACIRERAGISATSPVQALNSLPASFRDPTTKIGSQDRLLFCSQNRAPERQKARPSSRSGPLICRFNGVGEGTRTPGPQDHNLVL